MLFLDCRDALRWFLTHNPARAKHVNLLELSGGRNTTPQFSGDHPDDIWAQILLAAKSALTEEPPEARFVFNVCELGRPLGCRIHPRDIAVLLNRHPRTIYKYINRIYDEFERELRHRSLLKEN